MPKKFVGWVRLDARRWSPLCEAQSEDRCWQKLNARQDARDDEKVVLPEGVEPAPGFTTY